MKIWFSKGSSQPYFWMPILHRTRDRLGYIHPALWSDPDAETALKYSAVAGYCTSWAGSLTGPGTGTGNGWDSGTGASAG